jgi:hypothetical protein
MNINNDDYLLVGRYNVKEANRLLPRLESSEVRFYVEMDDTDIKEMSPHIAAHGGTFGQGVDLQLYVHQDDKISFHKHHKDVFDPDPIPQKMTLRQRLRSR